MMSGKDFLKSHVLSWRRSSTFSKVYFFVYPTWHQVTCAFSASMPLVGWQDSHPACINLCIKTPWDDSLAGYCLKYDFQPERNTWCPGFVVCHGSKPLGMPFYESCGFPIDRHHLSCDDCLEDKAEDYQNCSVLYCVPQLYTVISTHIHEQFLQVYLGLLV